MFKKIKKIIQNKKGDFAIFALCVIPVLLLIFTSTITSGYRESAFNSKVQTIVDNGALIASKNYAYVVSGLEESVCHFNENLLNTTYEDDYTANYIGSEGLNVSNKASFIYIFSSYLSKADGFNEFWRTSYTVIVDDDGAESLKIDIYYVIPKFKNSFAVVDSLGTTNDTDGWYKSNPKSWEIISSSLEGACASIEENCSSKKWKTLETKADVTVGVVSATTSCL